MRPKIPLNPRALVSRYSSAVPAASPITRPPPHLLSLADLKTTQIQSLIQSAHSLKSHVKERSLSIKGADHRHGALSFLDKTLEGKTIALMFSKRSTRTRVSAETSLQLLGGHPMFLGQSDIQLGVNESLYDTARVVSSMVDGIFARVGDHSEVESLAVNSTVPVINALSSLYHPMQILADLLTLLEIYRAKDGKVVDLESLNGLTVAWVGDANNILNDMIVTYPRLGINLQIATPPGDKYALDPRVVDAYQRGIDTEGGNGKLMLSHDPKEALKKADVVVTDTWVSMGQEDEKAQRLRDFAGFQVTEGLASRAGANKDWKFLHCLPRKQEEVDDDVFYGPRSVVFQEAENRKWTALATFDAVYGRWEI